MARPTNHDARISGIIKRLTAALSARARQETEARIAAQVAAIIGGSSPAPTEETQEAAPAPAAKKRGRKKMSPAARKAVGERMRKMWEARRAKKDAS